jgi:hypothetical protein
MLVGKPWSKGACIPWLLILIIAYAAPFVSDLAPDRDSYIGGYGPLGLWGTIIATIVATALSVGYGGHCVHKSTVYRCAGSGIPFIGQYLKCDDANPALFFPPEFTADDKAYYNKELAGLNDGITSHHPWSQYNKKLHALNNAMYSRDGKFDSAKSAVEAATTASEGQ